ncbi:MAG: cyclic nucleotide-binding domain-containing protein [Deltaproteobacteria bacterium]|nr:cyclic nucleotide-binding domain-containing protein [Deltaproteobacteria bacterium]
MSKPTDPNDTGKTERHDDERATFVPVRRRADTAVSPPGTVMAPGLALPSLPPDSYQPQISRGTGSPSLTPATQRELIVGSTSPVDVILQEIRKSPQERLEIEARAAAGGMGSIDIAVDRALDRRVALKSLHSHLRASEATTRMFLREARLTALLDHPNIVPVYDIGERSDDHLYFAMKLVEGRTLSEVIAALPPVLDTAILFTLLDVVIKVCDALAFAHSRGVLHCDIKPANVMVGEYGEVYVMDWGIARLMASELSPSSAPTRAPADAAGALGSATDNSVIGTPCYMSPEQARGDRAKLDPRSDVFLLGSLLYEILTRRPPYDTSDRAKVIELAASGVFPSPRTLVKDRTLPPELERIVLRAMAKEPVDRYPSVAALREDLSRFMRGGGDFPRRTFGPGESIVNEGDDGDSAFIILEGRCEIRKELPTGTEVLNVLGPGDVFGEMAILTTGPRTASVVTAEPTTVLVVTSSVLEQELAALKPWMATLLKSVATRFREIDTKHRATYAVAPSPARLANHVLMTICAWGESGPTPAGMHMRWSLLGPELEAQLGMPPLAIFAVATRYGMVLDIERDRLTIPDVGALRERLRGELAR